MFSNTVVLQSAMMPFLCGDDKVLYCSEYAECEVIVLNRL